MTKFMDKWKEAANTCLKNGKQLLDDADFLGADSRPSTVFALAVIAQEEFAKGFLFHLISEGALPAAPLVLRIARDHTCKQLMMLVMDYLNPDFEDFLANLKSVFEDRAAERFRRDVADAMNILRHEKVERWKSKNWFWAEEPTYDPTAKSMADGSFDREKQDALYVRVGGDGSLASTPASVRPEVAREAFERAGRLGRLVDQVLKGDISGLIDYERVKEAIGALFADLAVATDGIAPGTE